MRGKSENSSLVKRTKRSAAAVVMHKHGENKMRKRYDDRVRRDVFTECASHSLQLNVSSVPKRKISNLT